MFISNLSKTRRHLLGLYNSLAESQRYHSSSALANLPKRAQEYVEEKVKLCQPDNVVVCDGSEKEAQKMMLELQKKGQAQPLPKYDNCWLVHTDPADVARLESKTFMVTEHRSDTLPATAAGVASKLGNWKSPAEFEKDSAARFPGCMRGRTMYVLPFSMGPIGGPISKLGLQCTDSEYVVASMRIMTRMGAAAQQALLRLDANEDFVRCLHSVGRPLPLGADEPALVANWPCNPAKTMIAHMPAKNEIASFGSGYGGNSLLGKKCFALRLGSILAQREGWLAEHMLILGVTDPAGRKTYVAAAFPSACGKTNLAMMQPTLPGWKVECVGDDIAWMKFDAQGQLRAINPEAGFFGVAPGTSMATNPNAMRTIQRNTVFTNVAATADGGVFWEGLEAEMDLSQTSITSWLGQRDWKAGGKPAAHPNSRFCTPAAQCPVMDPLWESAEGVPISALVFGGRRPHGVPLVLEARNWRHGVFLGAAMRSETTAAAEHTGKAVVHDPFAMRPFFGYNFGRYLEHWLSFEARSPKVTLPKVFHVNWFRKDTHGKFLWPGFGENCRVVDWICRRVAAGDALDGAVDSPVGLLPVDGAIDLSGLGATPDMAELFRLPKDFWQQEVVDVQHYFDEQVGTDLPDAINGELAELHHRVSQM